MEAEVERRCHVLHFGHVTSFHFVYVYFMQILEILKKLIWRQNLIAAEYNLGVEIFLQDSRLADLVMTQTADHVDEQSWILECTGLIRLSGEQLGAFLGFFRLFLFLLFLRSFNIRVQFCVDRAVMHLLVEGVELGI